MSEISYNIISYDPEKLGLIKITKKVLADFLNLVGVDVSVQCLECSGRDQLVSEWETIGYYEGSDDDGFPGRLLTLSSKVASQLPASKGHKRILVTSIDIGRVVGTSYGWIAIISSHQIQDDPETFATTVFHELGHIHGAPNTERKKVDRQVNNDPEIVELEKEMQGENAIYECLDFGEHCLNQNCTMRQRLTFENWKVLTKERLAADSPYCESCLANIMSHFEALKGK